MSYFYNAPPPLHKKGELEAVLARRRQRVEGFEGHKSPRGVTPRTRPGLRGSGSPRFYKPSPLTPFPHPFQKAFRSPRQEKLGGKDRRGSGDNPFFRMSSNSSTPRSSNSEFIQHPMTIFQKADMFPKVVKALGTGEADIRTDSPGPSSARTFDSSAMAYACNSARTFDSTAMSYACNSDTDRLAELETKLELALSNQELQAESIRQALAESADSRQQSEQAQAEVARLQTCLASSDKRILELEHVVKTLTDHQIENEVDSKARLLALESHKCFLSEQLLDIKGNLAKTVQMLETKISETLNAELDGSQQIHRERTGSCMFEEETQELRIRCIKLEEELRRWQAQQLIPCSSSSSMGGTFVSSEEDLMPLQNDQSSSIIEEDEKTLDAPPSGSLTARSRSVGLVPILDMSRTRPLDFSSTPCTASSSCRKPEVFFMSPRIREDAFDANMEQVINDSNAEQCLHTETRREASMRRYSEVTSASCEDINDANAERCQHTETRREASMRRYSEVTSASCEDVYDADAEGPQHLELLSGVYDGDAEGYRHPELLSGVAHLRLHSEVTSASCEDSCDANVEGYRHPDLPSEASVPFHSAVTEEEQEEEVMSASCEDVYEANLEGYQHIELPPEAPLPFHSKVKSASCEEVAPLPFHSKETSASCDDVYDANVEGYQQTGLPPEARPPSHSKVTLASCEDVCDVDAEGYQHRELPEVPPLPFHSEMESVEMSTLPSEFITLASMRAKCNQSAIVQCVLHRLRLPQMKVLLCGLLYVWLFRKRRHPAVRQLIEAAK